MPIPADVVQRKLKQQLKNLGEAEKVALLQRTLDELPGFTSGPYGRLKNWIKEQMQGAQKQARIVHQEQFMVRKEGLCTAALIGPPNCGKSSLLRALSGRKVRIGDYPFTTLKPIAGIVKLHGAPIQLVEVPGLIEGASQGKGSGKAYLSAVRAADMGVFMGALTEHDFNLFCDVVREIEQAGIDLPRFVITTKADLPGAQEVFDRYRSACPGIRLVRISVQNEEGLEEVREALWEVAGLIRVFPRAGARDREQAEDPIVLEGGSTVADFTETIHRGLRDGVQQAQVWGKSVKFPGQLVPMDHVLVDADEVLLKIRRS